MVDKASRRLDSIHKKKRPSREQLEKEAQVTHYTHNLLESTPFYLFYYDCIVSSVTINHLV